MRLGAPLRVLWDACTCDAGTGCADRVPSVCADETYKQCLKQYHGWWLRIAARHARRRLTGTAAARLLRPCRPRTPGPAPETCRHVVKFGLTEESFKTEAEVRTAPRRLSSAPAAHGCLHARQAFLSVVQPFFDEILALESQGANFDKV